MAMQQAQPLISRAGGSRRQRSRLKPMHALGGIALLASCWFLVNLNLGTDSYRNVELPAAEVSHVSFVQSNEQIMLDKNTPPGTQERTHTEAGVYVSDPALYTGMDLHGDSSTATVMGLASGYGMDVYKRFVGSLRKTGYKGHIILGVAPDIDPKIEQYLEYRNVMTKKLRWVNCTYPDSNKFQCSDPYNDIKTRWSRFPLQRDWLKDCETCTGPVLTMDVRDSFFQLNPFGPGSPVIKGLQVYEEHKSQTTQHWLTEWPIRECKNVTYHEVMLCSGTTVGTRAAMLKYFEAMYEEMKVWINDPKCRFTIHGDDQSIHNYIFYSGQLPFATAIANRNGGIVNTVGAEASLLRNQQVKLLQKSNKTEKNLVYDGAGGERWIGSKFNLIDDEGYLTEFDGSRSRVIHQIDRFGRPLFKWLEDHDFHKDPMPGEVGYMK